MTAEHRKRSEPAMAGRDQRNEHRRQNGRLAPGVKTDVAQGTSRVSRAAGTIGSESMRVEQRSNPAATGQNSPRQAASKRTQSGKQATKRRTPAKQSAPAPTRDTRFIDWLRTGWENMEPHHQQRFLSVLLLLLSLLLFGALTLFRQAPILADLYKLSTAFFGWSAYLLALGLVAFALAHFVEGMFNKRLIRGSLMFWLDGQKCYLHPCFVNWTLYHFRDCCLRHQVWTCANDRSCHWPGAVRWTERIARGYIRWYFAVPRPASTI